jgi:deaminated glutathione amidase
VIAAAQAGVHNTKRESYGHALVVSPWGDVIAEVAGGRPGLATAEIDLEEISRIATRMPVQQHREDALSATQRPVVHKGVST